MRLLGDRVLVLLDKVKTERDAETGYEYQNGGEKGGGIILARPSDAFDRVAATRGIVAQLGTRRRVVDLDDVRNEVHTWFVDLENEKRKAIREGSGSWKMPMLRDFKNGVSDVIRKMAPPPFAVNIGDVVLFPPNRGEVVLLAGREYLVLHEDDILCVVLPEDKASSEFTYKPVPRSAADAATFTSQATD